MLKLILFKFCLLSIIVSNIALTQQSPSKANAKKKESIAFKTAISQPLIDNYDGSYQFIVESGVAILDVTFQTNVLRSTKSSKYSFTDEIITLINNERNQSKTTTKRINNYLEVEITSEEDIKSNKIFKTPFVSKTK